MDKETLTRAEAIRLGVACGAIDGSRLLASDRALLEQANGSPAQRIASEPFVSVEQTGDALTEADLMAFRDHFKGSPAVAEDARELTAHCRRLGHDYEVDGERVACGRCGAAL